MYATRTEREDRLTRERGTRERENKNAKLSQTDKRLNREQTADTSNEWLLPYSYLDRHFH